VRERVFTQRDRGAVGTLRRVPNAAVGAVLRSPVHRLLSGTLLLLTFRGRRTGRTYTLPLLYAREGRDLLLVALHPQGQSWWRNVAGGAEIELLIAGRRLRGRAALEPDAGAARRAFAAGRPWAAPVLRRARAALFVRVSPLD
jgi:hypothetical protein